MAYAILLVYVDADNSSEQRVQLAAKLAGRFNTTLIGFSALAVRPPSVAVGVVIEEETEADIKARLDAKGDWFRKIVGADRPKTEWRSVLGFPTEALAREARSADLVVIGQGKEWTDSYALLDPGAAILRAGRPFLVVPEEASSLRAEHVVIGWKDTREACRAVQDALPFLHEAEQTTIVGICRVGEEDATLAQLDDLVRYLARHRIKGSRKVVAHQEGSGAAQLIELAKRDGADLLVTGAYGHSRLGEWVFGGMTRDLLESSPICCLMSH